jgi:hypothetical protein
MVSIAVAMIGARRAVSMKVRSGSGRMPMGGSRARPASPGGRTPSFARGQPVAAP